MLTQRGALPTSTFGVGADGGTVQGSEDGGCEDVEGGSMTGD